MIHGVSPEPGVWGSGGVETAGTQRARGAKKENREPEGDRVVLSAAARLTPQQEAVVAQLAQIDRQVRAHEQAHLAAAGGYARGGPSYSYVTGPDGNLYAVSGEVSIDTSPVPNNPEETIRKMRVVEAAANAPVDPSPQDRQIAAAAVQTEIQAQLEPAAQRQAEMQPNRQPDRRVAAYLTGQEF